MSNDGQRRSTLPQLETTNSISSQNFKMLLFHLPGSIGTGLGDDEVEVLALGGLQDEARDYAGHAVHQQRAVVLDEAVAQLRDLRTRAQRHVGKALSSSEKLGFA